MNAILFRLLFICCLSTLSSCNGWPKAVSANFAKEVCSCRFVVGQTKTYCEDYHRQIIPVSSYDVNENEKTVVASGLGYKSLAKFLSPRLGCQLIE